MPNHVETLLTSLGVSAEDAANIIALPEADQFDSKKYTDQVKSNYQTQLQNDPAFFNDMTIDKLPPEIKKRIESSQYGRAAAIVRDKFLKGLGMKEEDLADLTEEQKEKLEQYIPAVTDKYAKTKAGDKQLQQDLIEARKKLEGFEGYEERITGEANTKAEAKVTAAIFNSALIGELSSISGLKISASDIAKTANDILQSKYSFERVGDYSVELRQKANPTMKVLKNGSSQELTLKEALIEIATERGWVEKESEGSKGSGTVKIEPNKNGVLNMVPPHLQDKISKKIAAEQ